jgi:hypothetical protein
VARFETALTIVTRTPSFGSLTRAVLRAIIRAVRTSWPLIVASVVGVVVAAQAQAPGAPPAGRAAADAYRAPRTAWGDPDLEGRWPSSSVAAVPLQRPESFGTRDQLTDEEFAQREAQFARQSVQDADDFDFDNPSIPFGQIGGGQSPPPHWLERSGPHRQASLIVDPPNGRLPALTPAARQRAAGQNAGRGLASYTDLSLYERCITRGLAGSILPGGYNNGNEIVQAPGYVIIVNEMIHEARVVPLDGRPRLRPAISSYVGDSRGRWEGDTLVVETTNFTDRAGVGVNGTGASDALKITERFRRTSATILRYSMTVDDPKTWTAPFTIQYTLTRDNGYNVYEYACHEGNYALQNILRGARAAERQAAQPSQR